MDFLRSSVDRGSEKVIDVSRNMGRSSRIKEKKVPPGSSELMKQAIPLGAGPGERDGQRHGMGQNKN